MTCVAHVTCQNRPGLLPPALRSGSKVKLKISREGEGLGTRLGWLSSLVQGEHVKLNNGDITACNLHQEAVHRRVSGVRQHECAQLVVGRCAAGLHREGMVLSPDHGGQEFL